MPAHCWILPGTLLERPLVRVVNVLEFDRWEGKISPGVALVRAQKACRRPQTAKWKLCAGVAVLTAQMADAVENIRQQRGEGIASPEALAEDAVIWASQHGLVWPVATVACILNTLPLHFTTFFAAGQYFLIVEVGFL